MNSSGYPAQMPTPFEQLTVEQAQTLIEADTVSLIDIRDRGSFDAEHIAGAITLDDSTVGPFLESADKTAPLLIYCYHGISSQGAAAYFAEQGFEQVYSLIGGFEAWQCAQA